MIFYLTNGSTLCGTQADARALDRDFEQIDIPVDKAGLMKFVNDLYARLAADADDPSPLPAPTSPSTAELRQKIDTWFEPIPDTGPSRPIDRLLATATYTEALRINQASVERMIEALIEKRDQREKRPQIVDSDPGEFS